MLSVIRDENIVQLMDYIHILKRNKLSFIAIPIYDSKAANGNNMVNHVCLYISGVKGSKDDVYNDYKDKFIDKYVVESYMTRNNSILINEEDFKKAALIGKVENMGGGVDDYIHKMKAQVVISPDIYPEYFYTLFNLCENKKELRVSFEHNLPKWLLANDSQLRSYQKFLSSIPQVKKKIIQNFFTILNYTNQEDDKMRSQLLKGFHKIAKIDDLIKSEMLDEFTENLNKSKYKDEIAELFIKINKPSFTKYEYMVNTLRSSLIKNVYDCENILSNALFLKEENISFVKESETVNRVYYINRQYLKTALLTQNLKKEKEFIEEVAKVSGYLLRVNGISASYFINLKDKVGFILEIEKESLLKEGDIIKDVIEESISYISKNNLTSVEVNQYLSASIEIMINTKLTEEVLVANEVTSKRRKI